MKYRKLPVEIEAIQLTRDTFSEALAFVGERAIDENEDECYIGINTLEGVMDAHNGDFIIRGVKGEFYPCKPDIFALTYEAV